MMHFRGMGRLGHCLQNGAGDMGNYMHNGWGIFMMLGALLVAVLIVVAIVVIIKKSHRSHDAMQGDDSMAVLDERFIKGEITEEEYTRMKKVLRTK